MQYHIFLLKKITIKIMNTRYNLNSRKWKVLYKSVRQDKLVAFFKSYNFFLLFSSNFFKFSVLLILKNSNKSINKNSNEIN